MKSITANESATIKLKSFKFMSKEEKGARKRGSKRIRAATTTTKKEAAKKKPTLRKPKCRLGQAQLRGGASTIWCEFYMRNLNNS